jgi:hypothetical protein
MTRRTSASRPMTGSSLLWRAIAVRSRQYFSRAWYWSSAPSDVIGSSPLMLLMASSTLAGATFARLSHAAISPPAPLAAARST